MTDEWRKMARQYAERGATLTAVSNEAERYRNDLEDVTEHLQKLKREIDALMDHYQYPQSADWRERMAANHERWRAAMDEAGRVEDELRDGMYVGDEEVRR